MFGQNYVKTRSDFSPGLINAKLNLPEYKVYKFKTTLLENIISVKENNNSNNAFFIEVPKSLFYKSIASEFEQYYLRSLLQISDFSSLKKNINDSWKYTTYYYSFFFSNVALHRYLNKGYIYLDRENTALLNKIFSAILPFSVSLGLVIGFFKR